MSVYVQLDGVQAKWTEPDNGRANNPSVLLHTLRNKSSKFSDNLSDFDFFIYILNFYKTTIFKNNRTAKPEH